MKQDVVHDFFEGVSKIILFVPVLMLVFLLFRFISPSAPSTHGSRFVTPSMVVPSSAPGSRINLTGPFVCDARTQNASISGFIKNKTVRISVVTKNAVNDYLLTGDCGYVWSGPRGNLFCGLGQYVALADSLLSSGILSPEMIMNSGKLSGLPVGADDVKAFIDSCKVGIIPDDSVFAIPRTVRFSEVVRK